MIEQPGWMRPGDEIEANTAFTDMVQLGQEIEGNNE